MGDIDELEGAGLDAAVAETVMGWHKVVWTNPYNSKDVITDWRDDKEQIRRSSHCVRADPLYLSGWNRDIPELLDKALADGVTVEMTAARPGSGIAVEAWGFGSFHRKSHVSAPTLPVALCRVLVKAYKEASHE